MSKSCPTLLKLVALLLTGAKYVETHRLASTDPTEGESLLLTWTRNWRSTCFSQLVDRTRARGSRFSASFRSLATRNSSRWFQRDKKICNLDDFNSNTPYWLDNFHCGRMLHVSDYIFNVAGVHSDVSHHLAKVSYTQKSTIILW